MSIPSIHIPGMLRGKLAAGFSNLHCKREIFDNSESAQSTKIREYLDTKEKCLIIANDGNGIDGKAGLERAVCFYMDSDPSEKHGRYGIGLKHALIQFTQLMKKATIITCSEKPNYSEKKTIEENRYNRKLYQIEVDFPTIMKEQSLYFKAQGADRDAEKLWERYAIDRYNTGTVIHIPCEDTVFSELLMMAQSTDIKTSLRYQLGITYQNYLKKNHTITLQIDDDIPVDIVCIERLFYEEIPKDDRIQVELTICHDSHRNIRVYVTKGKETGYYVQSNPNVNRLKFVIEAPSDEWQPFGKMTLRATYTDDWIAKQRPSLEANGVVLPDNGVQEIRTILGGAAIERNGKIVSIIPPTKATSGDHGRYKYLEEQHWSFSYTPVHENRWIENERIHTLDNLLGIEVNKSRIDPAQIHKNIWIVYQQLSQQFAATLYKKKEPQPNHNGLIRNEQKLIVPSAVVAPSSVAAVAAPSAIAASSVAAVAAPSSVAAVAASSSVTDSAVKKNSGPRVAPQVAQQVAPVVHAASSKTESSPITYQTVRSHPRSTPKTPKDIAELYKKLRNAYTDEQTDEMYRNASCVTEPNLSTIYGALINMEEVLKRIQNNQS